jgi:hypothetical protein
MSWGSSRTDRQAIIRLVGAVLPGQDDEWTEGRRYMGTEVLAACRKTEKQPKTHDAGVTIEAVSAEVEIDREVVISDTISRT